MNAVLPAVSRRSALKSAAAAVLATSCSAWGQPGRTPGRAITVAQIFDSSNEQQDVARDFTQAVPAVNASSLPIVRRYREVMSRLFDEPPVALSLAGFIAARYTYEVLTGIEGPVSRATALAAFQKRSALDLGGYPVRFDENHRSASYVTQSMLTPDGRVVG